MYVPRALLFVTIFDEVKGSERFQFWPFKCGSIGGADLSGEKVEFNGAGFGFEDGAVLGADGLAFLGEFSAVLLAVAENGDEAPGRVRR